MTRAGLRAFARTVRQGGLGVPFILMENSPSRLSSSTSMVHMFCEETGDRRAEGGGSKPLSAHGLDPGPPGAARPYEGFSAKRSA